MTVDLHIKILIDQKSQEWFNGDMTNRKTLNQADAEFLKNEFRKTFVTKEDNKNLVKTVVTEVNKLLLAQDMRVQKHLNAQTVRLLTQNVELEEKFEKKVEDAKSGIFDRIDPVLKEVKTSQEERSLIEKRVEALEEIHQTGKHSLATS